MDLISIIVPVYNAEKTIRMCVDSILNQSYSNIEIWLIDDGSTDSSGFICDEYANLDRRVFVIHHENRGVSFARNIGIRESKGKYILFVDSDDYVSPLFAQNLYEAIIKEDSIIMGVSGVNRFGLESGRFPTNGFCAEEDRSDVIKMLLRGCRIKGWLWNKIYKKELMNGILLNSQLSFLEDLEYNIRYLYNNDGKVVFIDQYDYNYNIANSSASHQNLKRIEGIEKFHESIEYLEDTPEKRYRYIRDYLSQVHSMTKKDYKKELIIRDKRYIRSNMIRCWKLMNRKEKIKCLVISISYKLFFLFFIRR